MLIKPIVILIFTTLIFEILSKDSDVVKKNWKIANFFEEISKPRYERAIITVPCKSGYVRVGSKCVKTLQ